RQTRRRASDAYPEKLIAHVSKGQRYGGAQSSLQRHRRPNENTDVQRILSQAQTGTCTMAEPSMTMQVRRPVANAPVSILIRFGRRSGTLTGVWPWTTNRSKGCSWARNS